MSIFEQSSRLKLRFQTNKGLLATEDLWDLSLPILDTLAKAVNKEVQADQEQSFIPTATTKVNKVYQLQLDVLKHIILVKVEEDNKKKERAARKAEREHLNELLANKQMEALQSLTPDQIRERLKALED